MSTKANLVIDQGTTFAAELNLTDENGDALNLNGFTANSQMRKWYTSSNVAATFTTNIDLENGIISLSLNAATTSSLTAGRYVYDVEITDTLTNDISRVVEGIITVTPNVTK
jgi:hypothetical protein